MSKYLIYFESNDPCCASDYKSQEQLLKDKDVIGTAWLVDEITGDEWGDDWNDAPACCNAGSPYENTCKGLIKVEMKLGEALPNNNSTPSKEAPDAKQSNE